MLMKNTLSVMRCFLVSSDCCIVYCLCCFNQKTAYGMRISAWSSDVCSSDLFDRPANAVTADGSLRIGLPRHWARRKATPPLPPPFPPPAAAFARSPARKKVVEGKSVCVREELGGGGNSKKRNVKRTIRGEKLLDNVKINERQKINKIS